MLKTIQTFYFCITVYSLETLCDSDIKISKSNNIESGYKGENFPKDYLEVDGHIPTSDDLKTYLLALSRVGYYYAMEPNDTDPNRGMGAFLAQGTLKRTLLDYGDKLDIHQLGYLKYIIKSLESYITHFAYMNQWRKRLYDLTEDDIGLTMSRVFAADTELLAHSLPEFSRGQLYKWILSENTTAINVYTDLMDTATLSRQEYIYELLKSTENTKYHLHVNESDRCLVRLVSNLAPSLEDTVMRPCRPNVRCLNALHKTPSIAYSLSHRQLQFLLYGMIRRCYFVSPEADQRELHILCAAMYREAVYIAKKGFFARDIFAEHTALCGMAGYEEFYRRNWLHKVASWVDMDGCVRENKNFVRYRYIYDHTHCDQTNTKYLQQVKYWYRKSLVRPCNHHLMAVSLVYLSNGVRHAAYHIVKQKVAEI